VGGQEVHLTPIEYRLLTVLVKHPGEVLMQRQLMTEAWGPSHTKRVDNLRVHVAKIRRKLEADPTRPKYLLTEQGVGYRLAVE
jgi:two-component system KDP operon response regulator KdpE